MATEGRSLSHTLRVREILFEQVVPMGVLACSAVSGLPRLTVQNMSKRYFH